MNLQLITAQTTAAVAGGSAAAAATGDSLTTANAKPGTWIRSLAMWSHLQTAAAFMKLTSQTGHDQLTGYSEHAGGTPGLVQPLGIPMTYGPQEALSIVHSGATTAGDIDSTCILMQYEDLPGIEGRFVKWDAVSKRIVRLVTVRASVLGAAAGGYQGEETLIADTDSLKPQQDYAVLGATVASNVTSVTAVTLKGPDTANLRVGIPVLVNNRELTAQWFPVLSRAYDTPCVPIINAGNRSQTFLGVVCNENGGATPVSLILGLLS